MRIAGADRAGRERLLRYCAGPPFALDHLHQHDAAQLLYDIAKPRPDGPRALELTPRELIDFDQRIALVRSNAALPLATLGRSLQRTGYSRSGGDQLWQLRAGARQMAELPAD